MKKLENNLDERQEQALLKIEHNGCWLAFWGLLAALLIQQFAIGGDFKVIVGEWAVFMVLALYLAIACLRAGIWDRRLKANTKTNFVAAVVAGAVVGVFTFLLTQFKFDISPKTSILAAAIAGGLTWLVCFITLLLMARSYNKRRAELDEEPEEEELA